METNNKPFDTILEDFQQCIKKPECFLSGDNSLSENLKISLKKCYDGSKCDDMVIKCNTLRELIIKQFDLEQVWQQIELQNDALLTSSVVNISKLIVNKDHLLFTNLEKEIKDAYIDLDEDRSITDDKDNGNTDDVSSKSDTEINDLDNEPFSNEESDDENNTDRDTPNTKKISCRRWLF
ncbi:hypothetical protein NQ318_000905 [Aromia moschata]|uniref:Uncharacterized protein n=1 Tax=Aromia moschata TaxID=1265417 RepID=A0AAV8ZE46_9CUCU|nr:hypothetical protein NQ318_000905 [Aromia moschata]